MAMCDYTIAIRGVVLVLCISVSPLASMLRPHRTVSEVCALSRTDIKVSMRGASRAGEDMTCNDVARVTACSGVCYSGYTFYSKVRSP